MTPNYLVEAYEYYGRTTPTTGLTATFPLNAGASFAIMRGKEKTLIQVRTNGTNISDDLPDNASGRPKNRQSVRR